MLASEKTGQDIYLSDAFTDFREIAAHYERLGAIVTLKYLDFDMIYQVIPFPEAFWQHSSPLRKLIGQTWGGFDRPLPDFLENFRQLCKQYKRARDKDRPGGGASLDCTS